MTPRAAAVGSRVEALDAARQALVYRLPRIRGACVLAVILIHVTASFPGRMPFDWFTGLLIYLNSLSRYAVPMFVLLSGFHLSLNSRNQRALPFYRRTLKLLVLPYVVYSAGYAMLTSHLTLAGFARTWMWGMVSGTAFYHLWFIPIIVELYILHPFLRSAYRRVGHDRQFVCVALVVQFAWPLAGSASPSTNPWLALAATGLSYLSYVGYFTLGYFLYDHADEVMQAIRRPAAQFAARVAWLAAAAVSSVRWAIPLAGGRAYEAGPIYSLAYGVPVLCVSLAAFVVLAAWKGESGVSRPVGRLALVFGLYAYGVYYLHPLMLEILTWTWIHLLGLTTTDVAFYLVGFPLVCTLSILGVKSVARLPFTRYLA